MSTSFADGVLDNEDEQDEKAELMARIEEGNRRGDRAEQEIVKLRKELQVMRSQHDEMANEQTNSEERDLQRKTEIDRLKAKVQESDRQVRELETAHQSDARLWAREKETMESKEAETQSKIQRLHEMVRTNGLEKANANRAGKSFAKQPFT